MKYKILDVQELVIVLKITVLQRKIQSRRVVSYQIKTDKGIISNVTPEDLKKHIENGQILVTNMTLTSDGRLVKSYRGPRAVRKNQETDFRAVEHNNDLDADRQLNQELSESLKMFEQLEPGMPFTFKLQTVENSEWKQAVYVGKRNDRHYFIDEQSLGMQGFSDDFLNRQSYFQFRTDDNDPVKVQNLLNRLAVKTNK